jgi:phage terminase small subunit
MTPLVSCRPWSQHRAHKTRVRARQLVTSLEQKRFSRKPVGLACQTHVGDIAELLT